MYTFLLSICLLILGYFLYSKFLERVFIVDRNRITPAYSMQDGVDYIPMPWYKIFLIQFLNIAGLGPIFGAVLGAMYGPVAFLWIVFGNILGGAMHDYFSGMLSIRENGLSLPEIVGKYLGKNFRYFMRIFTLLLMVLVGAVFVIGPAKILNNLAHENIHILVWSAIIFVYYFFATILPIDKLIGRIYPIFGFVLLFMALGIFVMLLINKLPVPELSLATFANLRYNSDSYPVFPMMFVTIACGAVSGFHSTQSPLMARCMTNERYGRRVFYGAMVAEGIVALIWAAAGMAFWGGVNELNTIMAEHNENAAWAVNEISVSLLGKFGAFLALLGVVAAPITTGDTAFRSARLILADLFHISQKKVSKRIMLSIPVFITGYIITQGSFGIIWRYMAWSNQTLAVFVLWTITVYLAREKKFYVISLIPAVFMTAVCSTYILIAPEGLKLKGNLPYIAGILFTGICVALFYYFIHKNQKNAQQYS